MPTTLRRLLYLAALPALVFFSPIPTSAQVEVEADPIAYALNGFSLHVAAVVKSHRFSVGTFGIDVPRSLHGNQGWTASMRGAGIKWDHLGSSIDGFFVGADAGYMRMSYGLTTSPGSEKRDQLSVGVRGGYRFPIGGAGLYLSPWVGVGYSFGGGDVELGQERFEGRPFTVFPTVHIGWRF